MQDQLLLVVAVAAVDEIQVLEQQGYVVTAVTALQEATALITQPHSFDLILLHCPFTAHITAFLHTVKTRPDPLPVLAFIEARDPQQTAWFDTQVDDYLVYPGDSRILLKRIELLLARKHLQAQVAKRDHILTVLQNITQAALIGLERQAMFNSLARQLGELFEADGCYITQWSEQEQMVKPTAAYGSLQDEYPHLPPRPGVQSITHDVLATGRPLIIPHVAQSPYKDQRITARLPDHSLLALPLIVDQRKLGAVIVTYHQEHPFSAADIAYAEQVTAQIGLALARVNSLIQEREQRELAETLREIANALNSSLALSEVLDLILEQLARVIPYSSASVMLLQDDVLKSAARRSAYAGGLQGTTLKVEKFSHVQAVITNHEPVIIYDTSQDTRWQDLPRTRRIRSWLGVPLLVQEQVIGLLNISRNTPHAFAAHEAHVAMTFANQAATAIRNARNYAQLADRATDLEMRVRQRTQELAEAYKRLQDLDRLKSKFIDDISHELRTPVTNLMLYLDLWEKGSPTKKQAYWTVLKKQTDRLAELVEGIIQLSQLELLQGQMKLESVDFNRLVQEVIQTQQVRILAPDVQLQVMLAEGLPPVWGDTRQLAEMIMHLVGNAINYTPSGTIQVQTSYDAEAGRLCLTVRDTGIGITLKDLPHVFERFYRGRGASQSNKPGVGLGLTVAQEVVRLHRGSITVDSEVGRGTFFYVWLPAYLPQGEVAGLKPFIEEMTRFN